ncbi:MAG: glycosyltransferase family 4 protein [Deltaproteobacteria bacterium]|nr:glycosyltransferase family 4 protein [Deltaproteobacteria bacterium]
MANVALVTLEYPPRLGGGGRSAARLAQFLRSAGHDVTVFAPGANANDSTPEPKTEPPDPVVWVPKGERGTLHSIARAIAVEDMKSRFDLFHGWFMPMAKPCLHPALHAARRRPVITSIRGIDAMWMTSGMEDLAHEVLELTDVLTSVNAESILRADRLANVRDRSMLIPNSVEASSRKWTLTPENAGVVGTVAVFRAKKCIPELIQAYALLARDLRKKLLLVGHFPEGAEGRHIRSHVERTVARYELAAELEVTGFVSNAEAREQLHRMRVFVVPSLHEGLPNAMLEAAAAGVPIVATNVDGNRDILVDGESARLVAPADVRELSRAIGQVLASDALATRLSIGGRAVASRLSPARERESWLRLYSQLLDPSRSARPSPRPPKLRRPAGFG